MKQKQPRTFIIYDTIYHKVKDGKETFWAIEYSPVDNCVAYDAEAALMMAKKQGYKLPVIGEASEHLMRGVGGGNGA